MTGSGWSGGTGAGGQSPMFARSDDVNLAYQAALPLVNAELADDHVLRASHLIGLLNVLAKLRVRHGDHGDIQFLRAEHLPPVRVLRGR